MNAERLHRVARAVADELASYQVVAVVGQLRTALQNLTNTPSDAAAQQQLSTSRTQLAQLADAPSNTWPPTDRQILEQLGIDDVLGEALLKRIEDILARNEITPSVALDEITPIHDRLTEVEQNLSALLTGLEFFGVSQDVLVDEFEVGVAIPRHAVDNKLPDLGNEFIELQKILAPFVELAGEGRPAFEVRAIASSDFGVFLAASVSSAYVLAKAIKVIVDTYDKILDIKRKRIELANLVPEENLSEVDAYANGVMEESLATLADELVEESAVENEGRRNELKIEVRLSLNSLANRIDDGYSVDIRTPELPEESAEEAEGTEVPAAADRARLRAIQELAARIRRLESAGARILQLPESTESPPDGGGDGA